MIRRFAIYYLIFMVLLTWGFAIGRFEAFPFRYIEPVYREIKEFVRAYSETSALGIAEKAVGNPQKDRHDRFTGESGFQLHEAGFKDDGYVLLSRYSDADGQSIVELMAAADGHVLHRWVPDIRAIAGLSQSEDPDIKKRVETARFRTLHPLPLNDGGLVFNTSEGPLVRIDACGDPRWVLDGKFHHSVELTADGTFWVPTINQPSRLDPPIPGHIDDAIARVSPDGELLSTRSVSAMLNANGKRGAVYAGGLAKDNIHLNDIDPLSEEDARRMGGGVQAGDVLLSMRTPSAIALYRPEGDKLIWFKTGPWILQHDPAPLPDGRISIFGNDIIGTHRSPEARSAVYFLNPRTGATEKRFEQAIELTQMRTGTEGRLRILDNGDAFIEEQNFARLLRLSETGVRWSYVNAMRNGSFGYLHWSRYLHGHEAADLLSVLDEVNCSDE